MTGISQGLYAKKNPRHYRVIGATRFGNEAVDDSVQQRRKNGPELRTRK